MGMRRKSSRTITVDGIKYRWLTNGNDYGIDLYVELYDQPAQKLRAVFDYDSVIVERRENGHRIEQTAAVSPGVVKQTIQFALQQGWKPEQRGENFVLRKPQLSELQ